MNIQETNTIALNKNALRNYELLEKLEAGIVLKGTEVKSLYKHEVNIKDAFVTLKNGEFWLINCNIPQYKFGNINNHVPDASRKLLLNKKQILAWTYKQKTLGLAIIPISFYWSKNKIKLQIALAKSLKKYDKRDLQKARDMQRAIKRF